MSADHTTPLPVASTAGGQLRAAREAAGLSQEAVAEQLKLAPRQVRAIEDDDYARLPGRTFVRGFVRNYARLLQLDASAVLAALPRNDGMSPLDRPSLSAVSRPMAELPATTPIRRGTSTRWLIPLALIAIVAAAGLYEYARAPWASRRSTNDAPSAPPVAPSSGTGGPTTTTLPNPLEARNDAPSPTQEAKSDMAPSPASTPSSTAAETTSATAAASTATTTSSADVSLLFTFNAKSWIEVKDASGKVIFLQTKDAGTTQTVSGAPPLDVVVGNAAGVVVSLGDKTIDTAPFTRGNIARFVVK